MRRGFSFGGGAMLDHIGFPVADFERAKAFYTKALAPLGYAPLKNVDLSDETGPGGYAGFGANNRPQFWIGTGAALQGRLHVGFAAKDLSLCARSYEARI